MSPAAVRLIPRVAPINPRAHKDVQLAQDGLERGMTDAINALASVATFPLTRTQCEHVVRMALLHTLFAVDTELAVAEVFAGLVDRLDRECWLVDGGAQ